MRTVADRSVRAWWAPAAPKAGGLSRQGRLGQGGGSRALERRVRGRARGSLGGLRALGSVLLGLTLVLPLALLVSLALLLFQLQQPQVAADRLHRGPKLEAQTLQRGAWKFPHVKGLTELHPGGELKVHQPLHHAIAQSEADTGHQRHPPVQAGNGRRGWGGSTGHGRRLRLAARTIPGRRARVASAWQGNALHARPTLLIAFR